MFKPRLSIALLASCLILGVAARAEAQGMPTTSGGSLTASTPSQEHAAPAFVLSVPRFGSIDLAALGQTLRATLFPTQLRVPTYAVVREQPAVVRRLAYGAR